MDKVFSQKTFVSGMEDLIPVVNDSSYGRVIAIGDIHGKFSKLQSLLKKIAVSDEDLIIMLGDYVDRGDSVAEVLEWIMDHKDKDNYIFLRGNHEQMMLDTFYGRMNKLTWFFNGGRTTISGLSKLKSKDDTFIERMLEFVESLPLYYSMTIGNRNYVFVHAGIDSQIPLEEQDEDFLLWVRERFFDNYNGDDVVISGHSPVQAFPKFGVADNPRPIKLPDKNIVLVDTGSFMWNGKISAVDILSGRYWQSSD